MKIFLVIFVFVASSPAMAASDWDWAYPPTPKREPLDTVVLKQVPGSDRKYTQAQIDDQFNPPDWFPNDHPQMPPIVAQGMKPKVWACALCHLPTGTGHPESASLAGLSASYMIRQMVEFKNGNRKNVRTDLMVSFAKSISEEDTRAAADYFAALKPRAWTKVVETEAVPKSHIGAGGMRFAVAGGETEPLGNRILVLPEDAERAASRDARSGFINYVPVGSIKRGETLVTTGEGGKTLPCSICHGLGDVPPLAGRDGTYLIRQLNDIKSGNRIGPSVALMEQVVKNLSVDEMVAIAAYLASREP